MSDKIQRWTNPWDDTGQDPDPHGPWVTYADHAAIVARKDARIAELDRELSFALQCQIPDAEHIGHERGYQLACDHKMREIQNRDDEIAAKDAEIARLWKTARNARREALEQVLDVVRDMMPAVWDESKIESFRSSGNSGDIAEAESHFTEVYILTKMDSSIRALITAMDAPSTGWNPPPCTGFNLRLARDVNRLMYIAANQLPPGSAKDAMRFLSLHDIGAPVADKMKEHRKAAKVNAPSTGKESADA